MLRGFYDVALFVWLATNLPMFHALERRKYTQQIWLFVVISVSYLNDCWRLRFFVFAAKYMVQTKV